MFTLLDFTRATAEFWRAYRRANHDWQSGVQSLTAVQSQRAFTLNRSMMALWTSGGSIPPATTSNSAMLATSFATTLHPINAHRDTLADNSDHAGGVLEVLITRLLDEDLVLTR